MKISVSQLRRIIREEVEQEKVRRIVREAVKSELNEGMWDDIKNLGSVVFTGKVGDMSVPKGVSKIDWVNIMKSVGGKAPSLDNDEAWAYIDAAIAQSRAGKEFMGFKTWKQRSGDELESAQLDRMAAKARKEMEEMTANLKKHNKDVEIERAADEERYAKNVAKRDAEMEQDEENREYRKKYKKSNRELANTLSGAMHDPRGSSGMGKAGSSW